MALETLIVVDDPAGWPLGALGAELVAARDYLTEARYQNRRRVKIFNLCRSYRYQSLGYYVSLLAEARGHRPLPSVTAIQDIKLVSMIRIAGNELDELIQRSLRPLRSGEFVLSIYFGHNLAKRYDRLGQQLFRLFQAPFLRAFFAYSARQERWQLQNVEPLAASEIPEDHRDFAVAMTRLHFQESYPRPVRRSRARFDLAILVNPAEAEPPSDPLALRHFLRAARQVGFSPELIDRDDFGRLAEFDALFIRETTNVNHHTYRFARRAAAEGLAVIDAPEAILKCTNKVFLAELLQRHRIAIPATLIVQRPKPEAILASLGLPCILKKPDGSFSQGVVRVDEPAGLRSQLARLLAHSDLVIAQQYLPTPFDWRIGIFDRQPLYACRYHMADNHWQILRHDDAGRLLDAGQCDTLPVEEVPPAVVATALKAANLIGDGLFGVDLKQVGQQVYVIEVNDNPSIDAGIEDAVLQDELYLRIMQGLMRRVELRKGMVRE
jgi:glutathione synthase/RimK-type ligase-like ATP-grasp enzyme